MHDSPLLMRLGYVSIAVSALLLIVVPLIVGQFGGLFDLLSAE